MHNPDTKMANLLSELERFEQEMKDLGSEPAQVLPPPPPLPPLPHLIQRGPFPPPPPPGGNRVSVPPPPPPGPYGGAESTLTASSSTVLPPALPPLPPPAAFFPQVHSLFFGSVPVNSVQEFATVLLGF